MALPLMEVTCDGSKLSTSPCSSCGGGFYLVKGCAALPPRKSSKNTKRNSQSNTASDPMLAPSIYPRPMSCVRPLRLLARWTPYALVHSLTPKLKTRLGTFHQITFQLLLFQGSGLSIEWLALPCFASHPLLAQLQALVFTRRKSDYLHGQARNACQGLGRSDTEPNTRLTSKSSALRAHDPALYFM